MLDIKKVYIISCDMMAYEVIVILFFLYYFIYYIIIIHINHVKQ